MANSAASLYGTIDSNILSELTQKTGLYVANNTLYYANGYSVMLGNEPNTEWRALFKTVNGVDLWTTIENIQSKYINRQVFFIQASDYDRTRFKIAFENNKLVQCYKF